MNETNQETPRMAFDALWEQMHPRLCRFVCYRMSNPDDAEDVLQEVFLRAYYQVDTVRDPERLESWIYQITRNRIVDYYRRQRRWVDLSETLAEEEGGDDMEVENLLPSVREAILSLPDPYRDALVLSDFQGLTQQELADQTGISLSGMKSRVQRARQKVKEALQRCYDFEFDVRGQVMNYTRHCCC